MDNSSQDTVDLAGSSDCEIISVKPPAKDRKKKKQSRKAQLLKNLYKERAIQLGASPSSARFSVADLQAIFPDAVLCNAATQLFNSTAMDCTYSCGYRNCQMLLSAVIAQPSHPNHGITEIPSVRELQELLESAWRQGFDRDGAEQLGHRVVDTRKWIGTTEIYCILAQLGIRSRIVDFHRPTGPGNSHTALFSWISQHFAHSKLPLYLQHQGHSRTVVGVEFAANTLLVFDPNKNADSEKPDVFRYTLDKTKKHGQFQLLFVDEHDGAADIPRDIASVRVP
ncbi:hypothetical protein FBU59_001402 [Linderina macrospora]|uniref:Uncharacterized protein n=1 Tax=Linderina macrospora TaxID=4868 RepID=A0ACC1JDY8_9FUNG|nr:hypothetical protein FBU59_001402 [Linderina macrospora]